MNLPLGTIATTRASRWAAVVIVVAGAAMLAPALRAHIRGIAASRALRAAVNALDYRLAEGRSSEAFEHRQMRAMRGAAALAEIVAVRATAAELRAQWESNRTSETARRAGVALFAAGEPDRAVTTLVEALRRATGERDPLRSIVACDDPALLIDFSAAALQRAAAHDDARDLLLAFEAADRAWRLDRRAGAAWNRALAEERIGVPAAAVRSWE